MQHEAKIDQFVKPKNGVEALAKHEDTVRNALLNRW